MAYSARRGFPFSTYGEGLFLVVQNVVIAFMVQHLAGKLVKALTFVTITILGIALLLSPLTSLETLAFLQAGNVIVVLASKGIQAVSNYQNGSTGQLSPLTVFLLLLGTLVRVFTSLEETGDVMLITSYVISSSFNLLIFLQVLYYRNCPTPVSQGLECDTETEPEAKNISKEDRGPTYLLDRLASENGRTDGSYVIKHNKVNYRNGVPKKNLGKKRRHKRRRRRFHS